MGEMADYYNNQQMDEVADLYDYQDGNISDEEAYERGIIDECGYSPDVNLVEPYDVAGLRSELIKCERDFLAYQNNRYKPPLVEHEDYDWVSGGQKMKFSDMNKLHLINAIKYAKRNAMDQNLIKRMEDELLSR